MNNTLIAKVNDFFELEISKESAESLDAVSVSDHSHHILHKNKSYKTKLVQSDFYRKTYSISVNNTTYDVVITDALDQLIKGMGFEGGATKYVNNVKAPMPGLILEIKIAVGQEVKENDDLLILEAMKMENVLISPRDGVIKSVSVSKGDAVDKNQLLIEFE